MSDFIVSARKYRPVTFASVVGQKHITSTLCNAIEREQLAHAYLFCGPRGVGKTTCARIFAKAINCLAPVNKEACGECESCKGFNEGRSFNIHELDAASNNSVDDIRSLTDQVRIPPQIGRYSVYIIDEVHMLSASAFNAFLKTLEEPPAHAIFVLATTEKHKIIPTILSRCQIFDFNRIRVEDGVEYLRYIAGQESIVVDDESLHLIAQKADGGMRDALSMFDKAVSFCGSSLNYKEVAQTLNVLDYDTYFNITSIILRGDYQSVLMVFDEVLRKGFSGQLFISGLGSHFRDLLMSKSPQTASLLEATGTLLEKYKVHGAECDAGFLFEAIALLTALDGTLRTATNQRLNIELGLMKLCGLSQKKNNEFGRVTPTPLPPLVKGNPTPISNVIPAPVSSAAPVSSVVGECAAAAPVITAQEVTAVSAPSSAASASASAMVDASSSASPVVAQEVVSVAPEVTAMPITEVAPKIESRATIHAMPQTISGNSIADILKGNSTPAAGDVATDEESEGGEVVVVDNIDPEAQLKISRYAERFLNVLRADRPRFAVAFTDMQVKDNVVSISVPNETLYEDILRSKTELLMRLAKISGVNGAIELRVVVRDSDPSTLRPVKIEDKLKYLTDKNPLLLQLRRSLSLDLE